MLAPPPSPSAFFPLPHFFLFHNSPAAPVLSPGLPDSLTWPPAKAAITPSHGAERAVWTAWGWGDNGVILGSSLTGWTDEMAALFSYGEMIAAFRARCQPTGAATARMDLFSAPRWWILRLVMSRLELWVSVQRFPPTGEKTPPNQ